MEKFTNGMYHDIWSMPILNPLQRSTRLVMRRGMKHTKIVDGVETSVSTLYISGLHASPYAVPDMTYGVYADSTVHDLRAIMESLIANPPSGMKACLRLVDDARLEAALAIGRGILNPITDIYGSVGYGTSTLEAEDARLFLENEQLRLKNFIAAFRDFPEIEQKLAEVDELNTEKDVIEKVKNYICHKLILMFIPRS